MNKWSRSTFALHHMPFIAVVAPAVVFIQQPVVTAFSHTLALDLVTCFNEALTAARSLGAPRWLDIPRCSFVCCVMLLLIPAELYELLRVWGCTAIQCNDIHPTPGLRLTATLVSLAAAYHVMDVLPCNFLGAYRAWRECWCTSCAYPRKDSTIQEKRT